MQHDDDWPRHDDWPGRDAIERDAIDGRDELMWMAMRAELGLPEVAPRPDDTSYAPYVSKEELEGDLGLAAKLFDHLSHDDKGVIFANRIEPSGRGRPSLDEQKARDAAARLLRARRAAGEAGRNWGEACRDALEEFYWDLASLIESRSGGYALELGDALELVLRRRPGPKAHQSSQLRESISRSLVYRVYGDGWPVEVAVRDVKDKHGVSEKTVWNIWRKRKFIEAQFALQIPATSLQRNFDDN
jgi:hypothetical protein